MRLPNSAIFALIFSLSLLNSSVCAETLVFYATGPGKQTLDQGEGGGNPFASALIEILGRPSVEIAELPAELRTLTTVKSRGFQTADVPTSLPQGNVTLIPAKAGERRIAMVMVVSDYTRSKGASSLPGAKHDAERVALALRRAGFETEIALDLELERMKDKLVAFRSKSKDYDLAAVYTTGHGVEVDHTVFLLPGDYPIEESSRALARRALPIPHVIRSVSAKQVNLIFYAGCRDNPFSE